MAPDINAEHSFFSIALHVHPEVVFKGCARGGGIGSIQRALELVYEVSGTVSVSNQHVISIHAQNDELFIGLESESPKFVKIDWRSIVTLTKNITHALVSSLDELWLLAAHPVAKCLSPECPPLLRAVEPLEHVPPVPGSLLETRGWQAKEALVCGQDAIEVGDCNVKMVDIEVEGIAKRNESAGGAGVAHGRVTFVGVVVQACALKEAEGDTTHLVLFDSAVGLELDAENEFGRDGLDAVRNFSDLVHALLDERGEFLVDSSAPFAPLGRG
jgi:hypothetical protein